LNEEEAQNIRLLLMLNKDHHFIVSDLVQNLNSLVSLLEASRLVHGLRDIGVSTANNTDGQEQIVVQKVLGELLNLLGKGGREHEGDALALSRDLTILQNVSDILLEAHGSMLL